MCTDHLWPGFLQTVISTEQNHVYVQIGQSGRIANMETHLSFFLSPTTILTHLLQLLWLCSKHLVACHRYSQSLLACFTFSLLDKCSPNKSTNTRLCYLQHEAIWHGLFQPALCRATPKCRFPNLVHRVLAAQITMSTVSADSWMSTRWWATPGSGHIFRHLWPMDKPLHTLSKRFRPSPTISDLYRPYVSL